jgi:hypothetical protein
MPRARRIDCFDSRQRANWHWCIFTNEGAFVCRGKTRLEAIRRAERDEGRYGHGRLLIAKHDLTGEKWVRFRTGWHLSEPAKGDAA